MTDYKEKIKITEEEKRKIVSNSPASLPLNPTAQGWSGQEIRKKLAQSIVGAEGSVLSLLISKIEEIGDIFNEINDIINVEISNLSNRTIDVYDENVVFDLEEGVDLTCHGEVESIVINLKGVKHGYYSGVNFKTSEQEELLIPSLQVVNESLLPLKFVRWNKILSIEEIAFKPNTTINMTFYSDGINIYGYVMEA